jgi:D-3-phosphoglycerate dehydrogenase
MNSLRILNIEPEGYAAAARDLVNTIGTLDEKKLDRAGLLKEIEGYDVLITRLGHHIDTDVLAASSRLKAVVSATTGLDHIDLVAAAARHVEVLSLKGEKEFLEGVTATAELAWGLLMAVMRRIPAAHQSMCRGKWNRDAFKGHELKDKRLGIVGLGRLGRMMAGFGDAFGMETAAHDPDAKDWSAHVARMPDLDSLLETSDVLSLHVPLTAETENLINGDRLARLPGGAVLINTSRGAVVDEAALLKALEGGRLAGAGLDVLAGEVSPGIAESPLLGYARGHDNLVLTPHIGGATWESMAAAELFMAEKLVRFMESNQ